MGNKEQTVACFVLDLHVNREISGTKRLVADSRDNEKTLDNSSELCSTDFKDTLETKYPYKQ